jgi:hypothetical protein
MRRTLVATATPVLTEIEKPAEHRALLMRYTVDIS